MTSSQVRPPQGGPFENQNLLYSPMISEHPSEYKDKDNLSSFCSIPNTPLINGNQNNNSKKISITNTPIHLFSSPRTLAHGISLLSVYNVISSWKPEFP